MPSTSRKKRDFLRITELSRQELLELVEHRGLVRHDEAVTEKGAVRRSRPPTRLVSFTSDSM